MSAHANALAIGGMAGFREELNRLIDYIGKLRCDIAAISPHDIRVKYIPHANENLGSVVQVTERAATQILDACDALEEVSRNVGGDEADRIAELIGRIYEACNFQDLTGQRVRKIADALEFIQVKLLRLVQLFGIPHAGESAPSQTEMPSLLGSPGGGRQLFQELDRLVFCIRAVREDITSISPSVLNNDQISRALCQLDAVAEGTNTAANDILDVCDALDGLAGNLVAAAGEKLGAATMRISDACTFQQETDAWIRRAGDALGQIERKLGQLAAVLGLTPEMAAEAVPEEEPVDDRSLLNGPQLPGQGMSQDDIDKLLADFG